MRVLGSKNKYEPNGGRGRRRVSFYEQMSFVRT